MPTLYSSIFTKTNILFEDPELLNILTDGEYNDLLEIFQSKVKIYFKSCKKDLNDVDDVLKQFNTELSNEEQWIIAEGIKLVWIEKQLYKERKLSDRMGTRDYTSHSPANLLDKLLLLKQDAEKSLKNKITDYTFNGFEGFK